MNSIRQYLSAPARRQQGFTMVEILVALMISVFLMAGMIQLFIGSKQSYRFHDAASRLQENGRLAIDTMATDIRMAGYQFPPPLLPLPPWNPSNTVEGIGNDITVRWIDPNQCPLPNRICSRAYSIGPRTAGGTVPTCPSGATSLRLDRDGGGAQELIEGVQAMQIFYGVCADANNDGIIDGPPTNYVNTAGVAANWNLVCSVRIHLLLVSLENNIVTQPQTVFFPPDTNTQLAVNDRCLRQAFSTTIVIRNRIP